MLPWLRLSQVEPAFIISVSYIFLYKISVLPIILYKLKYIDLYMWETNFADLISHIYFCQPVESLKA